MAIQVPWGKVVQATVPIRSSAPGQVRVMARILDAHGQQVGRLWNGIPKGTPGTPDVTGLVPEVKVSIQAGQTVNVTLYTGPLVGAEVIAFPITVEWTAQLLDPNGRVMVEATARHADVWRVALPTLEILSPNYTVVT